MKIEGPFKVSVVTDDTTGNRELRPDFTPALRALDEQARSDAFRA